MRKDLKTLHISHTDLDGSGAIIISRAYLENRVVKRVSYNSVNEVLTELCENPRDFKQLLITDLCLYKQDFEVLKKLSKKLQKIVLLDHHIQEVDIKNYINENTEIIIDYSKSGTKLTYEYFLKKDRKISEFYQLQNYIDIYDLWKEDNPEFEIAKDYNRLFWELTPLSFEVLFFRDPYITKPLENKLKDIKSEIKRYFSKKKKENLIISNDKILLSFLDSYIGEIKEQCPDYKLYINLNNRNISVRLSKDLENSEEIRDKILGFFKDQDIILKGGHKLAFGIRLKDDLNQDYVLEILKSLINLINPIL